MKESNFRKFEDKTPKEKLEDVIGILALNGNYWGYLFGRIKRVEDNNIPSIMGVAPGRKKGTLELRYNSEEIKNTDFKNLCHIIEHEGGHVINCHIPRLLRILSTEQNQYIKNIKSRIWNIASDCAVNVQMNIPRTLTINGEEVNACLPELYGLDHGYASEYYYEKLYGQSELECPICGSNMKNESLESKDSDSEKSDSNNQNNDSDGNSTNQSSEGNESNKCPICGSDHNGESIDSHSWMSAEGEEEEEAARMENNIKSLVRESYKSFKKNRGTLPGNLQESLDQLLGPPKVPYYQIIRRLVKGSRMSKFKTAYNRSNKKRAHLINLSGHSKFDQILPFPGKKRDRTFNIGVMIDTSASQTPDDIVEALSGIKDIIENDKHCKVTVIECDTRVNKEYEIERVSDIDFNISGRGGTTLQPGVERLSNHLFDVNLCFTDGMCDDINKMPRDKLPRKRMVWVLSPNGTSSNVNETGIIVWVDEKED